MVRLSRQQFEQLVLKALEGLPPAIRERMDNVDVVVREWPSLEDLGTAGLDDRYDLFGLYQGIPLTERTHYDLALPDKITIFRGPISAASATRADVVKEVRVTVMHEVAHHFGMSDAELDQTRFG